MPSWFSKLWSGPKTIIEETDSMKKFLVVGLGNIGPKYENTRHNIGFKILDKLGVEEELTFTDAKLGAITTFTYKGKTALCLKPATFMNLSGKAVRYWKEKENIPLQNILVITDDINLPFGTIRIKAKGSDGGHNGLKDVQHMLQTTKYHRFRFGVGADFGQGRQVDYVLGEWNQAENKALPERLQQATAAIRSFMFAGPANTMNQFNGT
ncbi:Peptidyl-tRNA hydrolase [Croceitalea dokdonensis DOKDO 023]|uniref:Peptidyl-tRNA hydrolase n=1 Tax=Croceitalea dokdonensis DOKDO 023 TaxID=1300341 RepID=A0A0P7AKF1_9FLAO|nr:aminoacyl-tRNA hydrolase [Croceitalea dokdonensis]KPM32317.1 Peptidyl-tRNA hydrolase [Croceitalea dokdonensis DOKDO 023]